MGFVEKTVRTRLALPADLPSAHQAQADGHPAGAAYESDDGETYHLTHAGWRRHQKAAAPAAPVAASAAPAAPVAGKR